MTIATRCKVNNTWLEIGLLLASHMVLLYLSIYLSIYPLAFPLFHLSIHFTTTTTTTHPSLSVSLLSPWNNWSQKWTLKLTTPTEKPPEQREPERNRQAQNHRPIAWRNHTLESGIGHEINVNIFSSRTPFEYVLQLLSFFRFLSLSEKMGLTIMKNGFIRVILSWVYEWICIVQFGIATYESDLVLILLLQLLKNWRRWTLHHASFNGRRRMKRVFWSFPIWHWGYFCPFTSYLMSQQLIGPINGNTSGIYEVHQILLNISNVTF